MIAQLLAGPVHVESTRRIVDKRHRMSHDNNNSNSNSNNNNNNNNNNSPLSENGPNRFGRKGITYERLIQERLLTYHKVAIISQRSHRLDVIMTMVTLFFMVRFPLIKPCLFRFIKKEGEN